MAEFDDGLAADLSANDLFRFTCEHCGQRIKVPIRRAGKRGKCPRCGEQVQIPDANQESHSVSTNQSDFSDADSSDDPETEIVYERQSGDFDAVDHQRISVSRIVLFVQGALLLFIAIASFFLGTLFGRSMVVQSSTSMAANSCVISGRIEFLDKKNQSQPDFGSVVICLPKDKYPDFNSKASVEGFRPGDPAPVEPHAGTTVLREIGGEFCHASQTGTFQLKLISGDYYLLVMSKNSQRDRQESLKKADLAQIGRYFDSAVDLIGERNYQWREITAARDRTINIVF